MGNDTSKKSYDNILKFELDDSIIWIYSIKTENEEDQYQYQYYKLTYSNNNVDLVSLPSPYDFLKDIDVEGKEIINDLQEFINFIAYKEIAEKNISKIIKR